MDNPNVIDAIGLAVVAQDEADKAEAKAKEAEGADKTDAE